jgi:hypothetical protein
MAVEVLAGRDTAIHWPNRQAVHQLWAWPAVLPPPTAMTLSAKLGTSTALQRPLTNVRPVAPRNCG